MPSIASQFNATSPLVDASWQPAAPGAPAGSGGGGAPFAALLDATTTANDASSSLDAWSTSAIADAAPPGNGNATGATPHRGTSHPLRASAHRPNAAAATSTNSGAVAIDPSGTNTGAASDTDSEPAPSSAAPAQAGTAVTGSTQAATTDTAPTNATASGAPSPSLPKVVEDDGDPSGDQYDRSDDSGSADAGATPAATSAAPLQPLAVPLAGNGTGDAALGTGNSSSPDATISTAARSRIRPSSALADDTRGTATSDKNAASDGITASDDGTVANAADQTQTSSVAVNTPGTNVDTAAQQAQAQGPASADPAPPPPNSAIFTTNVSQPLSRTDFGGPTNMPAASSASPGAATTGIAALPNFAIAAAGAATSSMTAMASATASTASNVPVAGLAVAIAARVQGGVNQFDIRLDPPELGRIDVRLGVDRDGQVTSHVTVDRPETLQLLQSQQPQLERALEQAGLKTADNGLQFTLRDQSFNGQNGGGNTPSHNPTLVVPDKELAAVPARPIYRRFNFGTGIDIRV